MAGGWGCERVDVHGPILNQASMAIDAAVDGQGVALARTALAAWDLIGGRLVRPFSRGAAGIILLLDRLPEGDRQTAQDCRLHWVAPDRGG